MNLDLSSGFAFADASGLHSFFLDHRMVHQQTSDALSTRFGGSFSTFGLSSSIAEESWLEMMQSQKGPTPQGLSDWLQIHALIHIQTYQVLNGVGTVAPDLSVVDFSKPAQFYDWMYVHSQMHDYEQSTLGLT